ncbi:T9SS type A sorting domain-containing protein [Flavicella sediminum]|uniref:T9SS type A sorting domain-containing protein n=1 Tax=Flavicella sediminum TaxID=2585141 RepID=UPI00111F9EEE|nr:T9SS type A sorting domain-containing protein [Flavicella sediminum]
MTTRIFTYLWVAVAFFYVGTQKSFAQTNFVNGLHTEYYGFDVTSGDDGWWMQHDEWTIAGNKGANGTGNSLKFNNTTSLTGSKRAFGSSSIQEMAINLEPGIYQMKAMVWLDSGAQISAVKANFRTTDEPDVNVVFDLSSVTKNEWVEVTAELNLTKAFVNTNVRIIMESSYGGIGTLYFDSFQILVEAPPVVVEVPLVASISTLPEGNISLEAGEYDVKLKVFVEENTAISNFYTTLVTPWKNMKWDLHNITKGIWVDLEQHISIEEAAIDSEFKITVHNNPEYGGGKGVFYVDDLSFVQTKKAGISADNFEIKVVSESCIGKNNGQLYISAKTTENYQASFNGENYDFTSSLEIADIAPGSYDLCIATDGYDSDHCYSLKIEAGQSIAAKGTSKMAKTAISIEKGTAPFAVFVNGIPSFSTHLKSFELNSSPGDFIEVKTAVPCEGVFSRKEAEVLVYPNPVKDILSVKAKKGTRLQLFTTSGVLLKNKVLENDRYELSVKEFHSGIYILKISHSDLTLLKKILIE